MRISLLIFRGLHIVYHIPRQTHQERHDCQSRYCICNAVCLPIFSLFGYNVGVKECSANLLFRRTSMSVRENRRSLWLAGVFLALAVLACNAPGAATPTQALPAPTLDQTEEASPTSPPPSIATDTPVPDVSGPGGCTLNAAYVADVTVPDDTELAPGEAFAKVWRVRNSGTCPWETGTRLVFVSGESMGGPAAIDVLPVAPGAEMDVSVDLAAPSEPGTYRGNWQLQAPDGVRFGSVVYVRIVVPEPATETPTPTEITVTPSITPTVTPSTTLTVTPSMTPTVPPVFGAVWEGLGGEEGALGAPTGDATLGRWVADQRFERGYMYWRNNEGSPANYNYVLYYQGGTDKGQGSWQQYEDTWTEDMDELSCPEATLPSGPIRGFGKTWCDHEVLRLGVGEAIEHEDGAHAGFQDFEGGTLLWTSRLHFIYALFADGTWQRFEEAP
jgi:hypothetical protein